MSESKESSNLFGTCARKSGSNDKRFHHLSYDGSVAELWTPGPISIRPVFYIVVTPEFREGAARYCHARASLPRSRLNGPFNWCQWEYRSPHGQIFTLKCKELTRTQRWNAESRNKNLNLIVSPMTEEEWEKAN